LENEIENSISSLFQKIYNILPRVTWFSNLEEDIDSGSRKELMYALRQKRRHL